MCSFPRATDLLTGSPALGTPRTLHPTHPFHNRTHGRAAGQSRDQLSGCSALTQPPRIQPLTVSGCSQHRQEPRARQTHSVFIRTNVRVRFESGFFQSQTGHRSPVPRGLGGCWRVAAAASAVPVPALPRTTPARLTANYRHDGPSVLTNPNLPTRPQRSWQLDPDQHRRRDRHPRSAQPRSPGKGSAAAPGILARISFRNQVSGNVPSCDLRAGAAAAPRPLLHSSQGLQEAQPNRWLLLRGVFQHMVVLQAPPARFRRARFNLNLTVREPPEQPRERRGDKSRRDKPVSLSSNRCCASLCPAHVPLGFPASRCLPLRWGRALSREEVFSGCLNSPCNASSALSSPGEPSPRSIPAIN